MKLKHCFILLSILLINIILMTSCAQQLPSEKIAQPQQEQIEQQQQNQSQQLPLSERKVNPEKCPDGIWDEAEQKDPTLCPEDYGKPKGSSAPIGSQSPNQQQQQSQQSARQDEISVKATDTKYKTVSSKPTSGWFKTGQDADIMLSGIDFNNTGGPLLFNHLGGISTDGKRLLVSDTWNNRILIWNSLPTMENVPPDIVLGQKDFISNNPGKGLDELNWPMSVSTANEKVVVADAYNNRILIWNSFPTQNAQPADFAIKTTGTPGQEPIISIVWPWGVWTDGTKLVVTSTHGAGKAQLWNSFPTRSNQPPDVILTAKGNFGTPRQITSNGKYLIISDHNAKIGSPGSLGQSGGSATFVWKNWPTGDDAYDFTLDGSRSGTFLSDGKLALISTTHFPLSIWNEPPSSAEDAPDLTLGRGESRPEAITSGGYYFVSGDGSGIASSGGRLYLALWNGNKIVVYNSISNASDQLPDFAIGAPDIYTNTLESNYFIANPVVSTDGKSLVATSDFDRQMFVWKSLPDESGAYPDFVYKFNDVCWAGDSAVWGDTLVIGGKKTICVWKKFPLNGEKPDMIFEGKIGDVEFDGIAGLALDDEYFYLSGIKENAAGINENLYVWEGGVPSTDSDKPKFIIPVEALTRLDSDGKHLVGILVKRRNSIGIWEVGKLSSESKPLVVAADNPKAMTQFNLPGSALVKDGHLFVADTGFGRIMVWNNLYDALAGKPADIVLGENDLQDTRQEIGRNKLFWPTFMAFDGSYLWVGEFKFSGRILRFSVH